MRLRRHTPGVPIALAKSQAPAGLFAQLNQGVQLRKASDRVIAPPSNDVRANGPPDQATIQGALRGLRNARARTLNPVPVGPPTVIDQINALRDRQPASLFADITSILAAKLTPGDPNQPSQPLDPVEIKVDGLSNDEVNTIQTLMQEGKSTVKQMRDAGISEKKYKLFKDKLQLTKQSVQDEAQAKISEVVANHGPLTYKEMRNTHGISEKQYKKFRTNNPDLFRN